jgi:hypothetical protein
MIDGEVICPASRMFPQHLGNTPRLNSINIKEPRKLFFSYETFMGSPYF